MKKTKYNQGDIVRYQLSFETQLLTIIEVFELQYRILWSNHNGLSGTNLMLISNLDNYDHHKLVTRGQ